MDPHPFAQRVWTAFQHKNWGFSKDTKGNWTNSSEFHTSPCNLGGDREDHGSASRYMVEYVELEARFASMYDVCMNILLWRWQEHNLWIAEVLCNIFSANVFSNQQHYQVHHVCLVRPNETWTFCCSQYWILCCFLTPHSPKLRCTFADIRNSWGVPLDLGSL